MGYFKNKPTKPKKWNFTYDLWKDNPELDKYQSRIHNPLAAPKERLPGNF